MSTAIETLELTRSFDGRRALDGLSLTIERGEVLALLGPNGAGKTTTVRLLNGVLRPDSGSASVLGLDPVSEGHELRSITGVLTENAGLDERLTALENLEYTARIRGMSAARARERATEVLAQFGMADRAEDLTGGFSTGQRKRVALARALLHDPQVLFLDEPTSGLDPTATRDVAAMITTLAEEHGRTVVLATHFLGEAGKLADRMAVLHHGVLQAIGRPDDLARELWPGLDVDIDIGSAADGRMLGLLTTTTGVADAVPTATGARVHVEDREIVPRVLEALIAAGVPVFAAEPRPPTLEDVYFEIEARVLDHDTTIDRQPSLLDEEVR